jgi:SAM-dependent methyltransferase
MWWRMGKRRIVHELMDEADPAEARQCLKDLVRINADFGGHATIRKLLSQAGCNGEAFSILDVGAASGDSARIIRKAFPRARVVNLDRNEVNLGSAEHPKVLADAFRLPFAPRSFDFVFSSLFVHHFSNAEVEDLLRNFGVVARKAVLIADLERHIVPYWFLRASRPIFGWHWMTVHDGSISVRAAFTGQELSAVAERAGLKQVQVRTYRPAFRIALVGRTDC